MSISDKELRLALEVITEGPASRIPRTQIDRTLGMEEFSRESLQVQETSRAWIQSKSVQALGIGEKITNGHVTNEISLRVYVEKNYLKPRWKRLYPKHCTFRQWEKL